VPITILLAITMTQQLFLTRQLGLHIIELVLTIIKNDAVHHDALSALAIKFLLQVIIETLNTGE
jgi:hypothetical protein